MSKPAFFDRALTGAAVICVLLVAGTYLVRNDPRPSTAVPESAIPSPGVDTVAMLVLSSTCSACTAEPGATQLRAALDSLFVAADRPRLIGVSLDMDVAAGMELIDGYGHFDEILIGHGLKSIAALHYIWQDSLPYPAVPQLIVFERRLEVNGPPLVVGFSERPLQRVVGLGPITHWVTQRTR